MSQIKTDEQLMLELQADRTESFEVLYTRHSGRILLWGKKKGLSAELAEELVQGVFSKLFRARGLYDPKHEFLKWLYVISHSQFLDLVRRESRHKADVVMSQTDGDQRNEIEASVSLSGPESQTEARAEAQQESARILEGVSPEEKELLRLRFVEQKSFREIAEVLGRSEVSLRQRVGRLLRRLRGES